MSNNVAVEFTVGQTNNIEAEYTVEQSQAIETEFTINITPTKVSELENDLEYQTRQDLETALEGKQDVLTAGTGITIEDNVISATGAQAVWGLITGDIDDQTDLKNALDAKQDVISDLSEIRSGAELGATALQSGDNVSELVNNAGFITSSALSPYALISSLAAVATSGSYNDLSNKPTIPAAQVNSDWNANSGVAQILNKPTLGTMAAESASDYTKTSGLATVATTGVYSDLTDKPTIPTDTSDLTNGAGFITSSALSGYQTTANLVTSVSGSSTDSQYPSAKCVYDIVGDIESTLNAIRGV